MASLLQLPKYPAIKPHENWGNREKQSSGISKQLCSWSFMTQLYLFYLSCSFLLVFRLMINSAFLSDMLTFSRFLKYCKTPSSLYSRKDIAYRS